MTIDDRQLLQQYVTESSEQAFAQLVNHHLGLVFGVALRRVNGDVPLAQDIAQLVFTNLARKASTLSSGVVLAGWLHRDTCFTALEVLRKERRRRSREHEALAMHDSHDNPDPVAWEQICPWLDDALNQLNPTDRDALLLRYFEQRSLNEIGQRLGFGESGASRRISRALDKVRAFLAKRGVATSATALSAALTAHAVQAAPSGLSPLLASASLAAAASQTSSNLGILKIIMSSMKLKIGIAAVVGVAVLAPIAITHHLYTRETPEAAGKQEAIEHLNRARLQVITLITFVGNNADKFPNTLEEAGITGDDYELNFKGLLPSEAERGRTIIIREKRAWRTPQGTWARAYGYADGHSDIRLE